MGRQREAFWSMTIVAVMELIAIIFLVARHG